MSSRSALADRPTAEINYSFEPTQTQRTIRVMRKPKRSPLRRVLQVLLVLAAGALALFIAAGIVGTISNHPAVPFKMSTIKTIQR
jgi:hypothetical protein